MMRFNDLRYRTRLTIAYTVIFALALLAFSALAYGIVRWSLGASTATRLQTTANAIRTIPDVKHGRIVIDGDDRRALLAFLSENRLDGAAVTLDGTPLISNVAGPPPDILAAVRAGAMRGAVRVGETIDYVSQPIASKTGVVVGYVFTWVPRSANDDIARLILLSLLGASIVIIAIAAVVGGLVMRQMLAPIVNLNAMMSAIEASDLSERLAWSGPDDELGRLCSTFDRLLERLQTAFERERNFTANASHELRTPLAVMRAEIELTLTRERDEATYRATLARLQRETNRLEALVESLLLTARSDAGLAAPVAQPLAAIAEGSTSRVTAIARERGVAIDVRADHDVWAVIDAMLLESALVAVLDNALRYTPSGGTIRIAVDAHGGTAVVAVTDGGAGFTPDALHRATQRFWRDDPSRSGAGMGLGLAIVAAIAERHGGTIALRNAGGGGVVELRLPAIAPPLHGSAKSGTIGMTVGSSA